MGGGGQRGGGGCPTAKGPLSTGKLWRWRGATAAGVISSLRGSCGSALRDARRSGSQHVWPPARPLHPYSGLCRAGSRDGNRRRCRTSRHHMPNPEWTGRPRRPAAETADDLRENEAKRSGASSKATRRWRTVVDLDGVRCPELADSVTDGSGPRLRLPPSAGGEISPLLHR